MMSFMEYLLSEATAKNVSKEPVTGAEIAGIVDVLRKAIKNVSAKYSKIMALFEILTNNTGFVSEQVLGYLLNQDAHNGIKATVNAKSNEDDAEKQGLSDLDITYKGKTYGMSLKTYNAKNNIDLGHSDTTVKSSDITATRNELQKAKAYDVTIAQLSSVKGIKPSTVETVKARVNAVVEKLCGKDDSKNHAETFCWFRKTYDKEGALNGFDFSVFLFAKSALTSFLMNDCVLNISDNAWSLNYIANGKKIQVIAPQAKNYLTLNRKFLESILDGTLKDLAVFSKVDPKPIIIDTDSVRAKLDSSEVVKKLQGVKIPEMIQKLEKLADEMLKI